MCKALFIFNKACNFSESFISWSRGSRIVSYFERLPRSMDRIETIMGEVLHEAAFSIGHVMENRH